MKEFNGTLAPFGSYVNFIPPTTTKLGRRKGKFFETTVPGIIVGHEIGYGGSWKGGYVVVPLEAIAELGENHPTEESTKQLGAESQ